MMDDRLCEPVPKTASAAFKGGQEGMVSYPLNA